MSRARLILAAAGSSAAAALAAGAAGGGTSPSLPDPLRPSLVATSFEALAVAGANRERLSWRRPEWWAARRLTQAAFVGDVVERAGTRYWAAASGFAGRIEWNTYPARPDGYSQSFLLGGPAEPLLARARGGQRVLRGVRLRGRAAWRAASRVRANECAGAPAGMLTVWLDRRTLLPLRMRETRGRRSSSVEYTYSRVGTGLPSSVFARPRLRERHERADVGFRRTAPAHASGPLSYVPLLPSALPPGYQLAVSGWAPRAARTGPEGSIAPHRQLFAAVYRRGFERIDVTQRLARGRGGWPADPFGAECTFVSRERTRVGEAVAWYGAGPETTPHLYWRAGSLLYTVSGPYPKATLVDVAASLRPLGS